MLSTIKLILLALFLPGVLFGQGIITLEDAVPSALDTTAIINHGSYILEYSEQHEQARWVVYKIEPALLDKSLKRPSSFYVDRMVLTGSAKNDDYKKSGYDRGHLKPAAASKTSKEDVKASFFYSNMSPQKPGFNRGIWKKLETLVREFAEDDGFLWVVTGPVLENDLPTIGKNEVAIPRFYYKVLLDINPPEYKAIAFLLPNESSDSELTDFTMSIDELEGTIGIDFFPNLDNEIEDSVEAKCDVKTWPFPAIKELQND
jgi:endonuclease G